MSRPIMCGVLASARATSWAEITPSSNVTVALLVLKATLMDLTPFIFLSDPSRVAAQAPQWSPLIKYVALTISPLGASFFGPSAEAIVAHVKASTVTKHNTKHDSSRME